MSQGPIDGRPAGLQEVQLLDPLRHPGTAPPQHFPVLVVDRHGEGILDLPLRVVVPMPAKIRRIPAPEASGGTARNVRRALCRPREVLRKHCTTSIAAAFCAVMQGSGAHLDYCHLARGGHLEDASAKPGALVAAVYREHLATRSVQRSLPDATHRPAARELLRPPARVVHRYRHRCRRNAACLLDAPPPALDLGLGLRQLRAEKGRGQCTLALPTLHPAIRRLRRIAHRVPALAGDERPLHHDHFRATDTTGIGLVVHQTEAQVLQGAHNLAHVSRTDLVDFQQQLRHRRQRRCLPRLDDLPLGPFDVDLQNIDDIVAQRLCDVGQCVHIADLQSPFLVGESQRMKVPAGVALQDFPFQRLQRRVKNVDLAIGVQLQHC
mmetsp:Transcript_102094/g.266395  ORF Transcript_102094/g.266395 Transcript_102094/m.266395 type:complete len:380 (-) Transcript_102094:648-1787(-)